MDALTLIIGDKNYSSWSLRPWLLLRQFGIAFDEVLLPLDTVQFHQRIGQYSPTGRVPALHVGDEVIWDSLAICETVNERWLSGRAWPRDARARAAARAAAAEMHSGFSALRSQLSMDCRRQPGAPHWDVAAARDIARIEGLWIDLRSRFGADGDFLCGEFGIVDAMFAPVCIRFRGYGIALGGQSLEYARQILALPAMREWQAAAEAEPARADHA
ncbi:MAG: glutathione S-transferase family protein [Arenimonas sp.]|nr:glutathione S-transferase family protein [Arenimonas sp.]